MAIFDNVLNFFITSAHADTAAAAGQQPQASSFPLVVMLVVFVLFMYFAVWRPQSRRAKEQRNLLGALAKGDEVITAGGILGRISKVSEGYVVLAIAENTEITIQKASIVNALPKGTLKEVTK